MGIGVSVLLLAAGAILAFAVESEVSGLDLDFVGVIVMIVGVLGLLWAVTAARAVGPWHRPGRAPRR